MTMITQLKKCVNAYRESIRAGLRRGILPCHSTRLMLNDKNGSAWTAWSRCVCKSLSIATRLPSIRMTQQQQNFPALHNPTFAASRNSRHERKKKCTSGKEGRGRESEPDVQCVEAKGVENKYIPSTNTAREPCNFASINFSYVYYSPAAVHTRDVLRLAFPSRVFQAREEEEKLHSQSNTGQKAPAHDSLVLKRRRKKYIPCT